VLLECDLAVRRQEAIVGSEALRLEKLLHILSFQVRAVVVTLDGAISNVGPGRCLLMRGLSRCMRWIKVSRVLWVGGLWMGLSRLMAWLEYFVLWRLLDRYWPGMRVHRLVWVNRPVMYSRVNSTIARLQQLRLLSGNRRMGMRHRWMIHDRHCWL